MTSDLFLAPLIALLPALSLIAKATVILAAGLVVAHLASRARAAIRHLVLAATFAALVVLPFMSIAGPAIPLPLIAVPASAAVVAPATPVSPGGATPVGAPIESGAAGVALDWFAVATMVWLAGSIACLIPLALSGYRHRRLLRTGLPNTEMREAVGHLAADAGVNRTVDLLVHEVNGPLTFGVRRPVIVMPSDARAWDNADLRRALVHELEHVRRADAATHTLSRVVCALWWFHPFVWAAKRRLDLEAERACDDAVVMKEENMEYAEQLVSLAERMSAVRQTVLGMANRSDLAARVSALLDARQPRGRAGAAAVVGTTIAATLLVSAIAPMRAVAFAHHPETVVLNTTVDGQQNRRQRGLDRELYEAAEDGDLVGITELLQAGASPNAAIAGDGSPLIAAARRGRTEAVLLLLNRGADPNLGVSGDGSPLIAAAAAGRLDITTLLLDRGAKVDMVVDGDENALINAAGAGHLAVVRLLVTRGADVNAQVRTINYRNEEEERSPLRQARLGGHTAVVAFLISAGAR